MWMVADNGCWQWTGELDLDGYASTGAPYRSVHRAVYAEHRGPIPRRMVLDHRCHTDDAGCPGGRSCLHRRCVNPDHLEPVSQAENLRRKRTRSI